MVLRQRSSHDDRFRSDVLGGIRTHGILLAKKDSTETELRGPRVRQQRDRGTTAPANVPRETRTLSLARAKGTFFLLELRARSFARWLSRSAVLATCSWARDDDTEPATAKSRVGFEPTMRWLCKPLRWTTLPPAHTAFCWCRARRHGDCRNSESNRGERGLQPRALPLSYSDTKTPLKRARQDLNPQSVG